MARPRKNRIGQYAALLSEEIGLQLGRVLTKNLLANQKLFRDEIAQLRNEIRGLERKLTALSRRSPARRMAIGKWVPGGPGRPPKDAAERIAAFETRVTKTDTKPRRKPLKSSPRGEPAKVAQQPARGGAKSARED